MKLVGRSATVTEKILEYFGFLEVGYTKTTFDKDIYLGSEVKEW